jgi:hypothetical protein
MPPSCSCLLIFSSANDQGLIMYFDEFLIFIFVGYFALIGFIFYYGPQPSIPDGLAFAKDRYGSCWEVTYEGSISFFRPVDCARAGFAPQGGR